MDTVTSQAFLPILLFLLISLTASYIFHRLRIPAGIILGPIFFFILLQFFGYRSVIPGGTKTVISSIFGVYFALKISSLMKTQKKAFFIPLLLTVIWFIAVTLLSSTVLRSLLNIDSTNAFLSVIPGGIAEINLISMSYEADLLIVNTFQIIRLFSVILLIPILFHMISDTGTKNENEKRPPFFTGRNTFRDLTHSIPVFIVGACGSILFLILKFPAGGLMGSLFIVLLYQLIFNKPYNPPNNVYVMILSFLGGIIGINMDVSVFYNLPDLIIPVLIITTITIGGAFLLALIIKQLCKEDYLSTLLGVMPGGLVVMLSIAESATCDILYVTSLQTTRLITAVVLIPNVLFFLGWI